MPFKVQVGPHQVSIHRGQTLLISEPDAKINSPMSWIDNHGDRDGDGLQEF